MTRIVLLLAVIPLCGCTNTRQPYKKDPLVHKQRSIPSDPQLAQPLPVWQPPKPPLPPAEALPEPTVPY